MNLLLYVYLGVIPIAFIFNFYFQGYTETDLKRINPLVLINYSDSKVEKYLVYTFLFFLNIYLSVNWIAHASLIAYYIVTKNKYFKSPSSAIALIQFSPFFRYMAICNFILLSLSIFLYQIVEFSAPLLIFIILLAFSNLCFLTSFLFTSSKLIDEIKLSDRNIYFEFVLIALFIFLSILLASSFLENIEQTKVLSYGNLKETMSNLFGYKQVRGYYWGFVDRLNYTDIFVALLGLTLTTSIIKSFYKAKNFKLNNDEYVSIAEAYLQIADYEKTYQTLNKIKTTIKPQGYYHAQALAFSGLQQFDKALDSIKHVLPKDEEYFLRDHCYHYILLNCPLSVNNLDFVEPFFQKWVKEVEQDAFLISSLFFHILLETLDEDAFYRIFSHAEEVNHDFQFSNMIYDLLQEDDLSILENYSIQYPFESIYIFQMRILSLTEVDLLSAINEDQADTEEIFKEFIEWLPYYKSRYEKEFCLDTLQFCKSRVNKLTSKFDPHFELAFKKFSDLHPETYQQNATLSKGQEKFVNNVIDYHFGNMMSKLE